MVEKSMTAEAAFIAIDLKSFYASVECRVRKLDPMTTNLVVADESRTSKTICLAVSPSLKAYGIPGRARLFEVIQRVQEVNASRAPEDQLTYIVAPPQMKLYLDYSTKIYDIYLRYIAPEDIHVYSIDEVMIDATHYLNTYRMTAVELAERMVQDIYDEYGITATAGIGTNLYLCKIAMDIVAKHAEPNAQGVRIGRLNERTYRQLLWTHEPITDFWRVGRGYAKKLAEYGMYTMGDVARCSIGGKDEFYNEELLYKLFGVNAELLIDHAWGYEPCTIAAIKSYKPENNSICSGQVLHCPYTAEQTRLVVHEMVDLMALDLVEKQMVTDQLVLTIGYDIENLTDPNRRKRYHGPVTTDRYGRQIPKHAHGTVNLDRYTASSMLMTDAALRFYDEIINEDLLVRRITITANHIISEQQAADKKREQDSYEQLSLFDMVGLSADAPSDGTENAASDLTLEQELEREHKLQEAMLAVKKRYGKNAMVKGMNLQEGATAMDRNSQIGGHKA